MICKFSVGSPAKEACPYPVLEVDLGAICENWRYLKKIHGREVAAVLKADAYGLGAPAIGQALYLAGCRSFFTAQAEEALALRPFVGEADIFVLGGIFPGEEALFLEQKLIPVLNDRAAFELWSETAKKTESRLPAVFHVDTQMHRRGLDAASLAFILNAETQRARLDVRYLMSHLASADKPSSELNRLQLQRFAGIRCLFPGVKTSFANSHGIFLGKEFGSDLARPGIALYGYGKTKDGSAAQALYSKLRPVVTLSAPLVQIYQLKPGDGVGYGPLFKADRELPSGTVAIGYKDGYNVRLLNKAFARSGEKILPLIGRVSMDFACFDLSAAPELTEGSRIILADDRYGADEMAEDCGTIAYEILTALAGYRSLRVYRQEQSGI